jgi:hypothetical protein
MALGRAGRAGVADEVLLMAAFASRRLIAPALAGAVVCAACAGAWQPAAATEPAPGAAGARERVCNDAGMAASPLETGLLPPVSAPETPPAFSPLALAAPGLARLDPARANAKSISSYQPGRAGLPMLSAERAQILLRSLTVPGWGQATLGHNGAAKVFILVETGIWASFVAFHIQESMRTDSYELSARLNAGIDLSGRDEEFRRIVGGFLSSDDYNRLVVYRDAANLYYEDPVRYREYIAEHELKGSDTWHWSSVDAILQYRSQRKNAQQASQRANTALALAIANRLVSALHAARIAGRPAKAHSWNFEIVPGEDSEALAFRCGVRTRF